MSQMFAVAKLAGMACKVKPKRPRQRETELGGSDTHNLRWRAGIGSKHADLNYSNRPVRTRMPGGVGGARSGILTAPIPISGTATVVSNFTDYIMFYMYYPPQNHE